MRNATEFKITNIDMSKLMKPEDLDREEIDSGKWQLMDAATTHGSVENVTSYLLPIAVREFLDAEKVREKAEEKMQGAAYSYRKSQSKKKRLALDKAAAKSSMKDEQLRLAERILVTLITAAEELKKEKFDKHWKAYNG